MSQSTIALRPLIDTVHTIVGAAEITADLVLRDMASGNSVTISLAGVRGVTSSFYNVLLKRVLDARGPESVRSLQFEFDNPAQTAVWQRSLDAVIAGG